MTAKSVRSWREPLKREFRFLAPLGVLTLLMLATSLAGLYVLSAGRSFVALESLWVSETKVAVNRLLDYNVRGHEHSWSNYRRSVVALGEVSRVLPNITSSTPDRATAQRQLLGLGLPALDVDPVLFYMRNMTWLPGVDAVLQSWRKTSSTIAELDALGPSVREHMGTRSADPLVRHEMARRIMVLDNRLDDVGRELTAVLTRSVQATADGVFWAIVGQFLLLMLMGGLMAKRLVFGVVNGAVEVRRQEERWRFAVEGANDAMWDMSLATQMVRLSRRWFTHLGHPEPEDEFTERPREELLANIHPDDIERVRRRQGILLSGQERMVEYRFRFLDAKGRYVWLQSRVQAIDCDAAGRPVSLLGVNTHVHERHLMEEKMRHMAWVDGLTGLPNRSGFQRALRLALDNPISRQELAGMTLLPGDDDESTMIDGECAVVVLNLDGFKDVNQEYGRQVGDGVLRHVAAVLENGLGDTEVVARTDGDGFSLLLRLEVTDPLAPSQASNSGDDSGRAQLHRRIDALLASARRPFEVDDHPIQIEASAGSALFPADGNGAEALLAHAEIALLQAKAQHRGGHCAYDPCIEQRARDRRVLAASLRPALERNEFFLVYQPIVHQATQRVCKAEVLLRWRHPQRGLVSPAEFIPVAEESGLILPIGDWILDQVDRDLHLLRAELGDAFQVSVNKSPKQFLNDTRLAQPREGNVLHAHQGRNLCVEITESMLMEASSSVKANFMQLRDMGIQVSLDDFGTGYSSLAYLKVFDIDYIKIDRSFVKSLAPASSDQALCEAMIVMAHKLNMQVIAEGVETAVQRELLEQAGCDYIQGYFYSPPKPLAEFLAWAHAHRAAAQSGVAVPP